MLLINGNWQQSLPATDRAIQFGDGCFTTVFVRRGKIQWPEQHVQRLRDACQRLAITPPDWEQLRDEMHQLATSASRRMLDQVSRLPASDVPLLVDDVVLKIVISRGSGGRGYDPAGCQQTTRILSLSCYPAQYYQWQQTGVRLALSAVRLGHNPRLAGIKHLNRLEQVLIRQQLAADADEALVLDSDEKLVECCAANLFWRKGDQVYTPLLTHCGVNGIMRQHIIRLLRRSGWHVQQVQAPLTTLQQANEVVICNALMPVLPVCQAHHWHYNSRQLYQFLAPRCYDERDNNGE